MATTATKAAAPTANAVLANSSSSNSNSNSNNNIISAPIKIPLSERFLTQTSTGSADSGVIVTSASQKQLCSSSQATLLQLQQLPVRSSSGSLSLHGSQPKWKRQQQQHRQQQQQQHQQQQQQLLLSQDSGIEQRVGEGNSSGAGGGQSNSSSESLGSSSGNEQLQVAAVAGRARAASALELSHVGVGVGGGSGSGSGSGSSNALRRIKYKSTNSTQGFDVEDRIEEVDIGDDRDDDEHDLEEVEDDDEDDGVAVDGDEDDTQSGIIINIGGHEDEEQQRLKAEIAAKVKAEEELPLELAPLTVAAAAAKRRDARSLGTDGRIFFPLLKINEDPHIDAKLINRKDGLQDTMYYLDEFGSPKLREKFARKQKQRLAKQQKALLKREREEQRKKRNTTVASNLAASGLDTKDHTTTTTTTTIITTNHCDRNRLAVNKQMSDPHPDASDHVEDDDDDADADVGLVKMRVRSHSHDNHYDANSRGNMKSIGSADDAGYGDEDDDEIETGAEAETALHHDDGADCFENVKTVKLARTQSCVSWTKVVQKFKHILGKFC
ncbi:hypothetical protein AWZ03_014251 [Drosophila navojoa]|uniref:Uncharacterized protein n=1 Tax=Drosophila navojoa TaxID=7232 RepID=A0A484ARM3_DRONA|nr:hypothetical protein AWZ03_014251 [Drosophila navojoa]